MSSEPIDGVTVTDEPIDAAFAVRVMGVSKVYGLWSSPNARLKHVAFDMAKGLFPRDSALRRRIEARAGAMLRQFHALEELSLDIRKGESWGFIGVNGSGKSTLLKMISGNLRPSSGRIEVNGRVAILDYSSGLHGDFTGRENIFLKASVFGMSRRETEAKLQSIIDFADIGAFMDQPVKTYSSGMTARLGFAIIAHTDADIIITDEALAVGDAFFVQKCMDHIRTFLKRGTFLFVSHSTNDVVSLCTKAVWLEHGQVRKIGSAKEVSEAYLGSQRSKLSDDYLTKQKNLVSSHPLASSSGSTLDADAIASRVDGLRARPIRDMRADFLNSTQFRADLELLAGVKLEGAGLGGAKVLEVTLEDSDGAILTWAIGGELVRLRVIVQADRTIAKPIVGFQLKDRLGQVLFADNTGLLNLETPYTVSAKDVFEAEFEFQMPYLPRGDYAVAAVVADGEEHANAVLHWVSAALIVRSVTSGPRHGLVGVPMQSLRLGPSSVQRRTEAAV